MNQDRKVLLSRGAMLALVLVLLVGAVGVVAAGGSGQARWQALHIDEGVTPDNVARGDDHFLVAFANPGTVSPRCPDGGSQRYTRGDVIFYEPHNVGPCWFSWFDATNSGLKADVDINAYHDECSQTDPFCDIFLSFTTTTRVPGVGKVRPQDIAFASWVPETLDVYNNWQLAFDGSDVGLTTNSEKIDGLFIFDPGEEPEELGCPYLALISTAGNYRVPDQWGGEIWGGGEDVLGFCVASFGWDTAGYWFLYHDGSAEGAPPNSLVGLSHEDGRKAYSRFEFLTNGPFDVDTAHGNESEVFNFFGQTGQYDGPTISFPDLGATDVVDSFTIFHNP